VKPGDPITLTLPSGAAGLRVVRPDGTATDLIPGAAGGTSVTYTQTDELGLYTATPIAAPAPSGSASPIASATAPPAAGSGAASSPRPDPGEPIAFAVDLFDVDESAIAPGATGVLENLGRAAGASSGASGAPGTPASAVETRPNARDEIWIPIVFLVLVVLCVEWALYHRDTVLRGWRGLTGRVRRSGGSG
jgi:hypothetical protein